MKASEFLASIPDAYSRNRQHLFVSAVSEGNYVPIEWRPIRLPAPDGRVLEIYVAADALMLGEPDDFVRINVSHQDAQLVADVLDCRLPTTKISDLVHQHAGLIAAPHTSNPDGGMDSTSRMKWHSAQVSASIGPVAILSPLVSTVGKDWVLTNGFLQYPTMGANYGWHCKASQFHSHAGIPILQPLGFAHNLYHTDYSQTLRLVSKVVSVSDGNGSAELGELDTVLQDPVLSSLISYEGPLRVLRHPAIPKA